MRDFCRHVNFIGWFQLIGGRYSEYDRKHSDGRLKLFMGGKSWKSLLGGGAILIKGGTTVDLFYWVVPTNGRRIFANMIESLLMGGT